MMMNVNDVDESQSQTTVVVPLLLSPSYARCKSMLHDELRSFRVCIKCCLLDHSSLCSAILSFSAFLLFTFLVPLATSFSIFTNNSTASTSTTSPPSHVTFNRLAQLPTSGLTTIAFITLTAFFRRHGGLRKLLFLDDSLRRDSSLVHRRYTIEIDQAFRRHLAFILLPSFSLELTHKIILFSSVHVRLPFFPDMLHNTNTTNNVSWKAVIFMFMLISWIYRTVVFLLVCVLFRLTCELQILRFNSYYLRIINY